MQDISRMQPSERRASPRRQQHKVRVQVRTPRQARGVAGWVIDRSRSGLCLLLEEDVKVGATVKVRPTAAPDKSDWVSVVVKNRRRREKGYVLGCKFVLVPPLVTLLLFG
jgi:hypothetical protein